MSNKHFYITKIEKEVDITLFVNGLIQDMFTSKPAFRFDEPSQLWLWLWLGLGLLKLM